MKQKTYRIKKTHEEKIKKVMEEKSFETPSQALRYIIENFKEKR